MGHRECLYLIKAIINHLELNYDEKINIIIEFLKSLPKDKIEQNIEELKNEIGQIYYSLCQTDNEKAKKFLSALININESESESIKETVNKIIIDFMLQMYEN